MKCNQPIFISALCLGLFVSCASEDNSKNVQEALEDQLTEEASKGKEEPIDEDLEKAKEIYYSLPSPLETSRMLKLSGAQFNPNTLHNTSNSKNYTTSKAKALNLGIYLADLSYCNVFHQQQQCVDYFAVTKDLGDGLGMGKVFTNKALDRINENLDNQDSVYQILTELYWKANDEMQQNELKSVNGMVAAGLWIEGMHIALKSYEQAKEKKEMLRDRIIEQRFVINELVPMISSMDSDGQLSEITDDLNRVRKIFDEMESSEEDAIVTEGEDGNAIIGREVEVSMEDANFKELAKAIDSLRKKYTSQS